VLSHDQSWLVRAENPVHGSDQQSCASRRPAVMITGHVPAVRVRHGALLFRMGGERPSIGTVALVDRRWLQTGAVTSLGSSSVFAGFRFPPEVISIAVRWYLRYGLSYREVEELLAERGVTVDHVTIYRWVQRFTPEFAEAARPCRHVPGTGGSSMRPT
jgi:hypothetical protein